MESVVKAVSADFPGISLWSTNIDAQMMWLTKNPEDYGVLVATNLFGDVISDAFAGLDAADRSMSLPARRRAAASRSPASAEVISRSLPKADRDLVRTEAMQQRVAAEVRSRAPRSQPRRRVG